MVHIIVHILDIQLPQQQLIISFFACSLIIAKECAANKFEGLAAIQSTLYFQNLRVAGIGLPAS